MILNSTVIFRNYHSIRLKLKLIIRFFIQRLFKNKESMLFLIDGKYIETSIKTLLEEKAENYLRNKESTTSIEQVYSPMPGLILKYYKNIDDEVKQGDPIILLEAMKMENEIHAPKSGIITNIHVKIGISVEKSTAYEH